MVPTRRLWVGTLGLAAIAGCGGGGGTSAPDPSGGPAPPPQDLEIRHGRFVGSVVIAGQAHFADALLTEDGSVRLHVGTTGEFSGAIPFVRHPSATQFAGIFALEGDQVLGEGVIRGESCADAAANQFCADPADGRLRLRFDPGAATTTMTGELEVAAPGGGEVWEVALDKWPQAYEFRAGVPQGAWSELLAGFASDGDTVVSVDSAGRLFFQSAGSGCTGNGSVVPHLDGEFNVQDVQLEIASCGAGFTYLNGEYSGLATTGPTDYWAYDAALRAWLTKSDDDSPSAAVTMWAPYIY